MTNKNDRLQILESLNSLDNTQTEKVLNYIKGLVNGPEKQNNHNIKREAMKQIRLALGRDRTINPIF